MQRAAAMRAGRPIAVYGVAALLCVLLAGCAADSEAPLQAPIAATQPSAEPELSAPEPEVSLQAAPKSVHKAHRVQKTARKEAHAVAKAAALPSFRCHIVRESDLEGAAGQPPETEPAKVDLYARVDPQAHTMSVERASDPAFSQAAQHCGDGKPSPAAPKKHYKHGTHSRKKH